VLLHGGCLLKTKHSGLHHRNWWLLFTNEKGSASSAGFAPGTQAEHTK